MIPIFAYMGADGRIRRIIQSTLEGSDQRSQELKKLAKEFGCTLQGVEHLQVSSLVREDEIIRRIREAARGDRESRLWIFAFVSAVASALSAFAAVYAVLVLKK